MEEVMNSHRSRRHRDAKLNHIEAEISATREARKIDEEDVHMWKWRSGFKKCFSTRETWMLIREERPKCEWAKGVWFPQATTKYAFITWLAMHNRLATGDRMMKWNQQPNTACVLCQAPMETRNHLFFHCRYSKQVWGKLMKGILQNKYTTDWNQLGQLATHETLDHRSQLLLRYTLQATVHSLWRERNNRRHGEEPTTYQKLSKHIDKTIRNRLSILRNSGDKKYEDILMFWFATRN
ncbi:uncharacterized protein LOC110226010 [Arabidopsis lyrata subsp. lyrata]|uniref:uncharacterized protein LOC110226010 n=1 Tax=Arabidopsis lyrata subsp. lyrata TaxID=81972 RepID=UPI000A29DB10|nr:uncharacterized protein LOC110226010 [Arabidopsis lyrata subsp. lyrata]|eukprot:XP_020872075.1 uncharacterized protein LOC110226010 [Arabidopsis lyrata subsp. lyrata]